MLSNHLVARELPATKNNVPMYKIIMNKNLRMSKISFFGLDIGFICRKSIYWKYTKNMILLT